MRGLGRAMPAVFSVTLIVLYACQDLTHLDTQSLLVPKFTRSEIFGFIAGFGTTFAAMPDLIALLRRHSSAGMQPRMAAIMGVFQVLWIFYGLLINSRPVIFWNGLAVLINFFSVGAWVFYARRERETGTD